MISKRYSPLERMKKEVFLKEFKDLIIEWTMKNEKSIIESRKSYCWKGWGPEKRDELEKEIKQSRDKNHGGIDLETARKIFDWGGIRLPQHLNNEEFIRKTREAFQFLDQGDCYEACRKMMLATSKTYSPAGPTKILGLSNQEKFAIYDSRVGNALKSLKKDNMKLILCPPGFGREGDHNISLDEWAANYEKLIWTLEVMKNYLLKEKQHSFRIADIEMALWVMGK